VLVALGALVEALDMPPEWIGRIQPRRRTPARAWPPVNSRVIGPCTTGGPASGGAARPSR